MFNSRSDVIFTHIQFTWTDFFLGGGVYIPIYPHRYTPDREGGNVGRVSPHHPTKDLGSVVMSPSGVRGRASAENGFCAYFGSERNHLEHPF